jgi:hypothetical protein
MLFRSNVCDETENIVCHLKSVDNCIKQNLIVLDFSQTYSKVFLNF